MPVIQSGEEGEEEVDEMLGREMWREKRKEKVTIYTVTIPSLCACPCRKFTPVQMP